MPSNARNLANLLGAGETTISAEKLGSDVAPGTEDYSSIDSLGAGTIVGETAFVEGSNRLYIWNGSGWYNIALINTTPTWDSGGQPASSYELDADSPQDATVITLAASDPEGLPISYNYTTSGSMDSIATISQDSSVFTITPKTSTQVPDGGTGSITFRATDGVNILPQVSSFTLNFVNIIDDSKHTTLLATATGTSDNNNITDASSNNHTITVNGDAYAGTFSPYRSGGYSTYFDGTTNTYLNVSSSSGGVAIGSGDFTISFWVYSDDVTSNNNYLLDYRPLNFNTGNHPVIYIQTDGTFRYKIAGTEVITGNTAISSKQWAYFCLARDNGTTKMYVNGTLQSATYSGTESLTNGSNRPVIGTGAYSISPMFNGYISDLRVVTSLDTTAYSVPTERMSAINNTQLLTCHLPYIIDGSTNSHSITVGGNVSTKPLAPYDYLEYSATDHGGSVYFDGTGDSLWAYDATSAYANPSGLNLRDSAFTLEFWFYLNGNTSGLHTFFNTYSGSVLSDANETLKFSIRGSDNSITLYDKVASTNILQTTKYIPQQTWNHFCWTRDASNNHVFYLNGEQIGTSTSNTWLTNNTWVFGTRAYNNTQNLTGYMSDISLIKGSVTRTSNFTPPTAPLSSSGTSLHIKGTDASIIDKSQSANLKLFGNTTGSTTQAKFSNTKSMYFDGTDDYITAGADAGNFGTGDFTIETWLRSGSWDKGLFRKTTSGSSGSPPSISVYIASETIYIGVNSGTADGTWMTATNPFTLNTWGHLAITRVSGLVNVYADGSRIISATRADNVDNDITFRIGEWRNAHGYFTGYFQDFRITKGLARYTAADETSNIPSAPLEG